MSVLRLQEPALYAFGPFVLDRDRRLLVRDGEPVTITPKAFDLLAILVERAGSAVSKDELMSVLWPETVVEEGNLAFQVSTLRKALGPEGSRVIATLPGRGYQFVAPIRKVAVAPGTDEAAVAPAGPGLENRARRRRWRGVAAGLLALLLLGAVVMAIRFRTPAPAAGPIRSLAVLPFKPLAAAQRDEALEMGMADTLITRLAGVPGVVVRPVSAVRRYSGLDDDALTAARDLGVDAVLEGSIQRRGARVRVTVRLIRSGDGKAVWSSRFDDDAHDLFAVQDHVAERVARELVPALSPGAQAQLAHRLTDDLEAYELYLKGRYWAGSDPVRAEEFYRRAVSRDPRFAAAWAGIADSWLFRTRFRNVAPRENVENARAAAARAVALDPALAEGHAALAQVYSDHDWDWERAEVEYRRALELNPNSDAAHAYYAYFLLFVRRDFEGALEHSRLATRIDPLSPIWATVHTFVLDSTGRHEEAIRTAEETLRLHPDFVPAYLHLGIAFTNAGRPDLAIERLQKGLDIAPDALQLRGLLAWAWARAGDPRKALAFVQDLESREGELPAHNLALAWTALGEYDRAFEWLERALRERIFLLRIVTVHRGFEPLRGDPRYADLVRRMGLPAR